MDQAPEGYNTSSGTYGAASSLRENGEVQFNFKEYEDQQFGILSHFYRIRIDQVRFTKNLLILMFELSDANSPS